ncbi:MAG: septum site-determining protein MinC [Limnobacter sp.]|nr:septum site-determining protein MinC [Limnobacter sp.]
MNTATSHLIDFKFATIKALSIHVKPAKEAVLLEDLNRRLKGSGGVYFGEPTVLDFSEWTEEEFQSFDGNLKKVVSLLIKSGVNPVELKVRFNTWENKAEDLGIRFNLLPMGEDTPKEAELPPQPAIESVDAPIAEQASAAAELATDLANKPEERKTMVVDQSVRSGQRIYAQGADLIVMGQVSAGAEVIADGNVHVYGVLRGRALAGAAGDTRARILSTCFEPELVSIAGYYLTFEADYPDGLRSNPTLVYLEQSETSAEVRLKSINIR